MPVLSMTAVGGVVTVIELVLQFLGVDLPQGSVQAGVNGAVALVGVILLIVGQVRRKDLTAGLLHKD